MTLIHTWTHIHADSGDCCTCSDSWGMLSVSCNVSLPFLVLGEIRQSLKALINMKYEAELRMLII